MVFVKYYVSRNIISADHGLVSACIIGSMPIVNYMIELGAVRFDFGLYGACMGGHLRIVKLMLSKIPDTDIPQYVNTAIHAACVEDRARIVKYLCTKYSKIARLDMCLANSCRLKNLNMVTILLEYGANNYHQCILICCECRYPRVLRVLLNKSGPIDLTEAIETARGNKTILSVLDSFR
jgi:hypothetical protein